MEGYYERPEAIVVSVTVLPKSGDIFDLFEIPKYTMVQSGIQMFRIVVKSGNHDFSYTNSVENEASPLLNPFCGHSTTFLCIHREE